MGTTSHIRQKEGAEGASPRVLFRVASTVWSPNGPQGSGNSVGICLPVDQ